MQASSSGSSSALENPASMHSCCWAQAKDVMPCLMQGRGQTHDTPLPDIQHWLSKSIYGMLATLKMAAGGQLKCTDMRTSLKLQMRASAVWQYLWQRGAQWQGDACDTRHNLQISGGVAAC